MNQLNPTIRRIFKILLLCVLGGAGMAYLSCTSCRISLADYISSFVFSTIAWFVLWMGNDMMVDAIEKRISWVDFPVKRLAFGIITTVVYSIGAILSLLWIWESLFHFDFGDYSRIVIETIVITFFISAILHGYFFLKNWKQSAIDAERFQKESIKAQYENLKSQVNPHFLFNSLNALTHLVYEDQEKAARFIKQLSEVYRYVLDTREREVVPLEEELKFLRSYTYLQEIRFENNLKIEIDLPDSGNVVPLALQLLVENAVKHNIVSKDDPLTVRIYTADGFIVVENNLKKKSLLVENESGMGLENIQKRYAFLTNAKVSVEESNGSFRVRLPVIELKGS